ncbi:hypothetical protein GQ54DRAFT_299720 [Martensiomyces pterosporus]|nr:hypothetical protein GQ54DRAFT_299720 [Martensiomyces pterosporus]
MRHFSSIASLATLLASALGHVSMVSPCVRYTPFCTTCPQVPAGESVDHNINAPIGTHEGISQPLCKYTTPYATPVAQWTAGATVTVEFNPHAAVHGGGHCQFSLSYDGGKTFVVIHDELKYCFTGSPSSSNTAGQLSYAINLPKDLPSGDNVIFAWSWNNAIGNREYYMNCADVSIRGTSNVFTGPEMLVANYGPDSPFIPEFNGDYETGLDLFRGRRMVTVTGSGGYSNSSVPAAPASPMSPPSTSSAGAPGAYNGESGAGSPGASVPVTVASPSGSNAAAYGGASSPPAATQPPAPAVSTPPASPVYGGYSTELTSSAAAYRSGAATGSGAGYAAASSAPAVSPPAPTAAVAPLTAAPAPAYGASSAAVSYPPVQAYHARVAPIPTPAAPTPVVYSTAPRPTTRARCK